MQGLLTKEDVRQFFGLKTIESTEKLLHSLGVPKMDFSLIGGKGIRYRKTDLEEALAKIEVKPPASLVGRDAPVNLKSSVGGYHVYRW